MSGMQLATFSMQLRRCWSRVAHRLSGFPSVSARGVTHSVVVARGWEKDPLNHIASAIPASFPFLLRQHVGINSILRGGFSLDVFPVRPLCVPHVATFDLQPVAARAERRSPTRD